MVVVAVLLAPASQARITSGGRPVALVTAETTNELVAVSLPEGRILRRLRMPADPENVETGARTAVVVSTRGAAVTIVDVGRLRVEKVLRGFGTPHIPLIGADGRFAYVTDDERGQLVVIDLTHRRVTRRVFVGLGAHHMAEDEAGNQLWIALGERARSIAIVDVSDPGRPHLTGHVKTREVHDLAFSPSGARVWVTYGDRPEIGVFSTATGRLVRLGPALRLNTSCSARPAAEDMPTSPAVKTGRSGFSRPRPVGCSELSVPRTVHSTWRPTEASSRRPRSTAAR
jgi:hypothetical protein